VIRVVEGDLASIRADALLRPVGEGLEAVSPSGRELERRAGEAVMNKLAQNGPLPQGAAVLTPAGGLEADFLIHVVVHTREEPASEAGVRKALVNGLRRAAEWELADVALPPLGTGPGHLDPEPAARVMVEALRDHMGGDRCPRTVTIVVNGAYELETFSRAVASPTQTE
jgi:O-acetyl-ADP-ribose deacetylase (regulator of RNase III)